MWPHEIDLSPRGCRHSATCDARTLMTDRFRRSTVGLAALAVVAVAMVGVNPLTAPNSAVSPVRAVAPDRSASAAPDATGYSLAYLPWLGDGEAVESEASVSVTAVAQLGGTFWDAAIDGDVVVAGTGLRVSTFRWSREDGLTLLGRSEILDDNVFGLQLIGDRVYAAAGTSGLVIVDVRDLNNPHVVSRTPLRASAIDVAVDAGYAYIAAADGLRIVDVSLATNPRVVGGRSGPGTARRVVVASNTAYVLEETGGHLWAVDVSNPVEPKPGASFEEVATDLTMSRGLLYVVGWDGLAVFDIADPDAPRELGRDAGAGGFALAVRDGVAFVGSYDVLAAYDVADPTSISPVGEIALSEPFPPSMLVAGPDMLVMPIPGPYIEPGLWTTYDVGRRLLVFDTTVPANLSEAGRSEYIPTFIGQCGSAGRYAACVGYGGIDLLDLASPEHSEAIGRLDIDSNIYAAPVVAEDHAFVLAYDWSADRPFRRRLVVIDLADPKHLREVASLALPALDDVYGQLELDGHRLFVSGSDGLRRIDVSVPARPIDRGLAIRLADAWAFEVVHRYAFVVDRQRLRVVELAEDGEGAVVAELALHKRDEASGGRLVSDRAHLFVPSRLGGLNVIDVSAPRSPRIVGHVADQPTTGETMCCETAAFLFDGLLVTTGNGLTVFDVADPSEPAVVGAYHAPRALIRAQRRAFVIGAALQGAHVYASFGAEEAVLGIFALEIRRTSTVRRYGSREAEHVEAR